MNSNIFLFLLIFYSIIGGINGGKFMGMIEYIIGNKWLYDSDGNLTIVQYNDEERTEEAKLFFKGKLTNCQEGVGGVYFDIVVCIPEFLKCPAGLTICYESNLKGNLVKQQKYEMDNVNNKKYDCGNPEYDHSLHINYNDEDVTANIVSSIDTNTYKIKVPKYAANDELLYCFKIRVGTEDSVQTRITDMDDKDIHVDPPLPNFDLKHLLANGWKNQQNKFHLFALDFIPKQNVWRRKYGDYYKKFIYRGSDQQCNLTMQFLSDKPRSRMTEDRLKLRIGWNIKTGEKVHHCRANYVDTSMVCPGPYRPGKETDCEKMTNLPADVKTITCKFETTKTMETTNGTVMRNILTTGYENEVEEYKMFKYFSNFNNPISEYLHKIYKSNNYHDYGKGTEDIITKKIVHTSGWEMTVPQNCITTVRELYVNCNGWGVKIGQYKMSTANYKNEKLRGI